MGDLGHELLAAFQPTAEPTAAEPTAASLEHHESRLFFRTGSEWLGSRGRDPDGLFTQVQWIGKREHRQQTMVFTGVGTATAGLLCTIWTCSLTLISSHLPFHHFDCDDCMSEPSSETHGGLTRDMMC